MIAPSRIAMLTAVAGLAAAAGSALGQPAYSIDYQGPPIGVVASPPFPVPITEGDILMPAPFPPGLPGPGMGLVPSVLMNGGFGPGLWPPLFLPMWNAAVGHPAGIPGLVEVDGLSFATDTLVSPALVPPQVLWIFSVDEYSTGLPGTAVRAQQIPPLTDAAADIFIAWLPMPGPVCAPVMGMNFPLFDGDGIASGPPWGVSLVEPTAPAPGPFKPGSNIDALDVDVRIPGPPPRMTVYSLDSGFPDPVDIVPNTNSAVANGWPSGAALIMNPFAGGPVLYCPPPLLGLDLAGMGTDDIDGLIYADNGDGVYTPPVAPYSWIAPPGGVGTDMIFFSLRRGSTAIGKASSGPIGCPGLPIEPGDILVPGNPTPGVWIPAEWLGLRTLRSGANMADDVDALDVVYDCNANMRPDNFDVLMFGMPDCDNNLTPDSCQPDTDIDTVIDPCDNCQPAAGRQRLGRPRQRVRSVPTRRQRQRLAAQRAGHLRLPGAVLRQQPARRLQRVGRDQRAGHLRLPGGLLRGLPVARPGTRTAM